MSDLEMRVRRLEKSARLWRIVASAFGITLAVAMFSGAQKPPQVPQLLKARRIEAKAITAGRLSIVDSRGDEIGYFGVDQAPSGVRLTLFARGGKKEAEIKVDNKSVPSLEMANDQSFPGLRYIAEESRLVIYGRNGEVRGSIPAQ